MLHQDYDPNWRRASGNMYCYLCLDQYRKHPYFDEQLGMINHPIDHRLCNGDVVHL
jgi:hypothetical protein